MQQVKRRRVIEVLAIHGPDQRNIIDHLAKVRQHVGDFHAAFAAAGEAVGRRHQAANFVGELDLIDDIARRRRAGVLLQHRLAVEQVNLAGAAVHEEVDDGFRFRLEMRLAHLLVVNLARADRRGSLRGVCGE